MNLVNEQHVSGVQVGENGGQVAGALNGRAGGDADVLAHFGGHNAGQGGFAKARRAVEQHVIQRVVAGQRRLNVDAQAVLHGLLAHIIPQGVGAQALLHGAVLGGIGTGHQSVFHRSVLISGDCGFHMPAMARRARRISSSGLSD